MSSSDKPGIPKLEPEGSSIALQPSDNASADTEIGSKSLPNEPSTTTVSGVETPQFLPKRPDLSASNSPSAGGTPSTSKDTPTVITSTSTASTSSGTAPASLHLSTNQSSSDYSKNPRPTGKLPLGPSAHKRKRDDYISPQDKLEGQLIKNDMNSVRHWIMYLRQIESAGNIDAITNAYSRAVDAFPYAADFWIRYIQAELDKSEFKKAEALFARCLTKVSRVKLWNLYLVYVLRTNNVQSGGDTARNVIMQSYEFALKHIGIDRDSGPIWAQYIDFIRTKQPQTTWEQQQQMDLIRKTYRRAVCIPLSNVEVLWHAYNTFENGISKTTARKFLSEKSSAYMTARSAAKEMAKLLDGLYRDGAPIYNRRRSPDVREAQTRKWQAWLDWEKSNPLGFENKQDIEERVKYTYKQAATSLWFSPDFWFNAASYSLETGEGTDNVDDNIDEGIELLQLGLEAIPSSFLLYYKLAEVYESHSKFPEAKASYASLIEKLKERRELLEQQYKEQEEADKSDAPNDGAESDSKATSTPTTVLNRVNELSSNRGSTPPIRGDTPQPPPQTPASQLSPKLAKAKNQLDIQAKTMTHAYISYMKAVMRMEGITQARQIFSECRRATYATYHIYVASAMMESHDGRDDIAIKIFEIGAKRYPNAEFIREYLGFLISHNDDTNARALFEKSIKSIEPSEAKILYQQFLQYEAEFGELSALLKLEARYRSLYPDESALDMFMERYEIPTKASKHAIVALHNHVNSKAYKSKLADFANTGIKRNSGYGDGSDDDDDDEDDDDDDGRYDGYGQFGKSGNAHAQKRQKKLRHGDDGHNGNFRFPGHQDYDGSSVSANVMNVMKALPPPQAFTLQQFDPSKVVNLLQNVKIPDQLLR